MAGSDRWEHWLAPTAKTPNEVLPLFGSSCKPYALLTCEDVHPRGPMPHDTLMRSLTLHKKTRGDKELMCSCCLSASPRAEAVIQRSDAAPIVNPEVRASARIDELKERLLDDGLGEPETRAIRREISRQEIIFRQFRPKPPSVAASDLHGGIGPNVQNPKLQNVRRPNDG